METHINHAYYISAKSDFKIYARKKRKEAKYRETSNSHTLGALVRPAQGALIAPIRIGLSEVVFDSSCFGGVYRQGKRASKVDASYTTLRNIYRWEEIRVIR